MSKINKKHDIEEKYFHDFGRSYITEEKGNEKNKIFDIFISTPDLGIEENSGE